MRNVSIIGLIVLFSCVYISSLACADNIVGLEYSLSLSQAIANSLEHNRTYDNVKKSIRASELQYHAVTKDRLPRIETDYSYSRIFNNIAISSEYPSDIDVDLDPDGNIEHLAVQNSAFEIVFPQDNYTWTTSLTMPLFTGGLQECAETIAKLGIDVSKIKLLESKNELTKRVKVYYFTVLRDQLCVSCMEQNLASLTEHERLSIQFYKQGEVAKNAMLEATVQKANAEQELASAQQTAEVSWAVLKTIMVVDLDKKMTLEDSLGREKFDYSEEQCVEFARNHNPEIIAFTYLKEQASQAIRLEKSYYNPTLGLSAYYMKYGDTPGMQAVEGFPGSVLIAMLNLKWLLLDWGKKHDEAEVRKVELEQIINNEKTARDNLRLRIRQFYAQLKVAEKNIDTSELAVESAKENLRIARVRFREQAAPPREVIDATTDLKKAEYNHYTALYNYNVAIAELHQAMGTDTEKALTYQDRESLENQRLIEKAFKRKK